jgi:hypothetical protein
MRIAREEISGLNCRELGTEGIDSYPVSQSNSAAMG